MRWGAVSLAGRLRAYTSGTLLAATVAASPLAATPDLSDQQKNAVNHIAQVMASEAFCPRYTVNTPAIALLAQHYRIDLSDNYIRNVMILLIGDHRRGLEQAGKQAGCLVAYGLYGPGGENVPNLLLKR